MSDRLQTFGTGSGSAPLRASLVASRVDARSVASLQYPDGRPVSAKGADRGVTTRRMASPDFNTYGRSACVMTGNAAEGQRLMREHGCSSVGSKPPKPFGGRRRWRITRLRCSVTSAPGQRRRSQSSKAGSPESKRDTSCCAESFCGERSPSGWVIAPTAHGSEGDAAVSRCSSEEYRASR